MTPCLHGSDTSMKKMAHWHPTSREACHRLPKNNLPLQRRSSHRGNHHKRGPYEGGPPRGSLHEGELLDAALMKVAYDESFMCLQILFCIGMYKYF